MDLSIPDMTCGHCSRSVTAAVKALDPKAEVAVDLSTRRARVETSAPAPAVIAALAEVGFDATPV
ncbi:MAG: heavy-metal-associated domain-containing protein [Gemmobacter sp.]|uniref:heavy-metal-associated domain-containing protein n=1 Tax=Gemmobacter sp. TaxID=1898957 RepID=UPI00391C39DA